MNALLCLALAFSSSVLAVPGEACRDCHASLVDAYRKTGMGRSVSLRPVPPSGTYYHRRSNRTYQVTGNGMRRHQAGPQGSERNVVEKTIDIAVGSGNHAITYLNRTPQGRLLELPLSWYASPGAWAMSPGYDRADHEDFRRELSDSCLFCHSNGPEPQAIDCKRCHGSSDKHLQSPGKGTILNPARLSSERQLDVCLQCHLQTTSSGLQDSIRRPGRSTWSYEPGTALAEYKMYFDRVDSPGSDRLEINHAGYRLMQSECFRKSEGKLLCTSCHDPHSAAVRTNACSQCHTAHRSEPQLASGSCTSCHMPKRVPVDAVQTVITDHKIVRKSAFTDPREEDHSSYAAPVVAFFTKPDELSHAAANLGRTSTNDVGVYRRLVAREPNHVPYLTGLGKAMLRANRPQDALPPLKKALTIDPMHTDARNHLGVTYAVQGRYEEALSELRRAVADNPDHALAWTNLGITLEAAGQLSSARDVYDEAIRIQPDSTEARRRRADVHSRLERAISRPSPRP